MSNSMTLDLNQNFSSMMARTAAFMPENAKTIIFLGKMLLEELLCWLSTPVELLLRKRFGVRTITLFHVLPISATAMGFSLLGGIAIDPAFAGFLLLAAGLGVFNIFESRSWESGKGSWRFTYADGDPHPELWQWLAPLFESAGLDPNKWLTTEKVVRFYEPAAVFLVGILAWLVSWLLAGFLVMSSAALLLKAHIRHMRRVNMIRDRNDALFSGQFLSALPNRNDNPETENQFVAQVAISRSAAKIRTLPDTIPLPPAVRQTGTEPRARIMCPKCTAKLTLKPGMSGCEGNCPKCGARLRVPAKTAV